MFDDVLIRFRVFFFAGWGGGGVRFVFFVPFDVLFMFFVFFQTFEFRFLNNF